MEIYDKHAETKCYFKLFKMFFNAEIGKGSSATYVS